MSKKILFSACTRIRAVVVGVFGQTTEYVPIFGIPEASVVG